MMTAGTIFSGIGAPECAAPAIDWRWSCEIDPFASAVHAARFPGVPNLGDITTVDWHAVEPVDLVVGGPPCQDYSVAGQRASLSGARGDLTLQYARTLDAIDPAWSVTENVPGWLSTPDNAFGTFLGILAGSDAPLVPARGQRWTDAGVVAGPRRTIAWAVKDAQHFGVPQRRRRVFVVSCRGAGNWACAAALFPLRTSLRRDTAPRRETREDIAACAGDGTAFSLDCENLGAGIGVGAVAFHQNVRSEVRITEVMGALNAGGGKPGQGYPAIAFQSKASAHQSMNPQAITPGIDVGKSDGLAVLQAMSVRRLIPRECARLQGFPDDHCAIEYRGKPAADGPMYRAYGNSMAVPVIGWVLSRVQQIAAAALEKAA